MSDPGLTFFYTPQTRAATTLVLLEELAVPYRLHVLDLMAGQGREPAYLSINPLGKVPAIRDGDAVVTEQVAIFLHLADRFAERGLAPAIGDPLRGPYLRWMVFYAAAYEPALVDRGLDRPPGRQSLSPYGSFDGMLDTVRSQLATGPFLLGGRFSAADILWAEGVRWGRSFDLLPADAMMDGYVARIRERPGFAKAAAVEARVLAARSETGAEPSQG